MTTRIVFIHEFAHAKGGASASMLDLARLLSADEPVLVITPSSGEMESAVTAAGGRSVFAKQQLATSWRPPYMAIGPADRTGLLDAAVRLLDAPTPEGSLAAHPDLAAARAWGMAPIEVVLRHDAPVGGLSAFAAHPTDGALRIVGRKATDLIKCGGFKVGAGEVEAALLVHPSVREAAVIGAPDPDLGERIVAFVVADGEPSHAPGTAGVFPLGLGRQAVLLSFHAAQPPAERLGVVPAYMDRGMVFRLWKAGRGPVGVGPSFKETGEGGVASAKPSAPLGVAAVARRLREPACQPACGHGARCHPREGGRRRVRRKPPRAGSSHVFLERPRTALRRPRAGRRRDAADRARGPAIHPVRLQGKAPLIATPSPARDSCHRRDVRSTVPTPEMLR